MSEYDDLVYRARNEADQYVRWLDAGNSTGFLSVHAVDALADSFRHFAASEIVEARNAALEEAAQDIEEALPEYVTMEDWDAGYHVGMEKAMGLIRALKKEG